MGLHQLFGNAGNAGKLNAVAKRRGFTGRQASPMLELHCRFGARAWFKTPTIAERTGRTSIGPKAPIQSAGIGPFASENRQQAALRPSWLFGPRNQPSHAANVAGHSNVANTGKKSRNASICIMHESDGSAMLS